MGCAGSKPEEKTYLARPSISGAADAPAQAQASEAQKDAAAEDIQNAAASYLTRKKKAHGGTGSETVWGCRVVCVVVLI